MSAEQNKEFILRYFDALAGKEKTPELVGRFVEDAALREHIAVCEAAFPRYEMKVEDVVAEGDRVVVRFTGYVRHLGDFMGVPASGREASFPGIIIYRVEGEKIVEHWLQIDAPALMGQLTAAPALAATA